MTEAAEPRAQLVLPAAGRGARLGHDLPKALAPLGGVPMLVHTLRRFDIPGIAPPHVIVAPPDYQEAFAQALAGALPEGGYRIVAGGLERQQSVERGLDALHPDTEIAVIHDAARPFAGAESILASIRAAAVHGASTVAAPSVDTILQEDGHGFLAHTPDRALLWACQTPQTFRVEVIRQAHRKAREEGFQATDDATLVRRYGGAVQLVEGSRWNLKVTSPADLAMAEWLLERGIP